MERVEIACDSDLSLIVNEEIELLVSSIKLRKTSKIFRAMLSQRFAEGQTLRADNLSQPVQVKLPEDDSKGMKLLCFVLHQRNDLLPSQVDPSHLAAFATMADKYQCVGAVKFTAKHYLGSVPKRQVKGCPQSTVSGSILIG